MEFEDLQQSVTKRRKRKRKVSFELTSPPSSSTAELPCDYVLVWEEKTGVMNSRSSSMQLRRSRVKSESEFEEEVKAIRRESFETQLEEDATIERIEERQSDGTVLHYVLVAIRDETLMSYVHRRHIRLPLVNTLCNAPNSERSSKRPLLVTTNSKFSCFEDNLDAKIGCRPVVNANYTLPISELDAFNLTPRKVSKLLTPRQRQEIANHVLMTTKYVDPRSKRNQGLGLGCLLSSNVYKAAFCPHESLAVDNKSPEHKRCTNLRTYLCEHWATLSNLLVKQPLDHIREYFGETVTFYFAWLDFYTWWLIPAALVGLLVFILGIVYSLNDEYTDQICNTNLTLCPLCELKCSPQRLSDQCINSRISRVFDYPGSIGYSLFMTFWAVFFLEFWKRENCKLACQWDVIGYQTAEEPSRPDYINYCAKRGDQSAMRRRLDKVFKMSMSCAAIFLLVIVVSASALAVILYRLWVRYYLVETFELVTLGTLFASISAAAVSCVLIFIFEPLYRWIAIKLTDLERHEYQSAYERSLAMKLFVFSFVNFFASTLYVAFFMGRFMGIPGKLQKWFGQLPPEACTGQDCVFDMTKHICTVLAIKTIVRNLLEHALPWMWDEIKKWWRKKKAVLEKEMLIKNGKTLGLQVDIDEIEATVADPRLPQMKEDLKKQPYDTALLFDEYLDMVLQFGYVVMFGAACPLIALIAVINNAIELRLDAKKLLKSSRRPVASRAQNIGVWEEALTSMLFLSILTNGCYIAFTTDFLQRQVYSHLYSPTRTMAGYMRFRLVSSAYQQPIPLQNGTFTTKNETCYYFSDDNNENIDYFYFMAYRLSFVLIFENFAIILVQIIRYLIPDEPSVVRAHIRREKEEVDQWHETYGRQSLSLHRKATV